LHPQKAVASDNRGHGIRPGIRPQSRFQMSDVEIEFRDNVARRTRLQWNWRRISYSAILLAILVTGLIAYKGYTGLIELQRVHVNGTLELRNNLLETSLGSEKFRFVISSVEYLQIIWPALLFGILIAGAVHAFVSPAWLVRRVGEGVIREQVTAALAGTPLMLCSCCASPLFSATYKRSKRLSPSLALLLASPGMNPAGLSLCFMLFPVRLAAARVVMTLVAVLLASRLPGLLVREVSASAEATQDTSVVESKTCSLRDVLTAYLRSCRHIAIRTIPLVLLGVLVVMLIPRRLLPQIGAAMGGRIVVIAVIAMIAVPLALPSFFEIPLASSILAAGAPVGAAAAVLFAGPIVNLPSLLVVGRSAGWRASALLASSIWLIAFLGGLVLR
jgi:uncharacterized protein